MAPAPMIPYFMFFITLLSEIATAKVRYFFEFHRILFDMLIYPNYTAKSNDDSNIIFKLDRTEIYTFKATGEITEPVHFSINTNLANIVISNNVSCQIQANHKNILGKFILTATYNNVEYTKEISVVPLW